MAKTMLSYIQNAFFKAKGKALVNVNLIKVFFPSYI